MSAPTRSRTARLALQIMSAVMLIVVALGGAPFGLTAAQPGAAPVAPAPTPDVVSPDGAVASLGAPGGQVSTSLQADGSEIWLSSSPAQVSVRQTTNRIDLPPALHTNHQRQVAHSLPTRPHESQAPFAAAPQPQRAPAQYPLQSPQLRTQYPLLPPKVAVRQAAPAPANGTGTISGAIYEADGVTPIEGAEVWAELANNQPGGNSTTTDATGYYQLTLDPGEYLVGARAPNRALRYWSGTFNRNAAEPVTVQTGQDTGNIVLWLEPGGSVAGVVRDNASNVLALVGVNADFGNTGLGGCTDANGAYLFENIAFNTPFRVMAPAPGIDCGGNQDYAFEYWQETPFWDSATQLTLDGGTPDLTGIDFTLDPAGTISGTVYEADGATPLANVWVHAESYDNSSQGEGASTDVNGYFQITNLAPGNFRVSANGDQEKVGYVQEFYNETYRWDQAAQVNVVAGSDTPNIDFTLDQAGTIGGTAYDASHTNPLPGIGINIDFFEDGFGMGGCTDANGNYSIGGLPYGLNFKVGAPAPWIDCGGDQHFAFEFWQETSQWDQATVLQVNGGAPALTGIDFTLDPGGTVNGTVYEADGITPLANVGVSLDANGFGIGNCTDADGNYSLAGVPFGVEFQVRAPAPWNGCGNPNETDYGQEWWQETAQWSSATTLSLSPATQDLNGIDFTLDPAGKITGHVYAEDGVTPIEGVWVWVTEHDSDYGVNGANTDANGYYEIGGLPATTFRVSAQKVGYANEFYDNTFNWDQATPLPVAAGQTVADIDFTLTLGGDVSGAVYEADGVTPIPSIGVNLDTNGFGMGACTDANGHYTLTGVPYGVDFRMRASVPWNDCGSSQSYAMEFWQEAATWDQATVLQLNAGTPNLPGIDFTLDPGGTVTGVVTEQGTTDPLAGLFVFLADSPIEAWACTDANGQYSLRGLPRNMALAIRAQSNPNCGGPQNYAWEYWQETVDSNQATLLTLTNGTPQIDDINFTLEIGGFISGIVYEADGVTPVVSEAVSVEGPGFGDGTCTDGSGRYSVGPLPFGIDWRAHSGHQWNWCAGTWGYYLDEFWQEADNWDAATVLALSAGTPEYTDINFTLDPGAGISGLVQGLLDSAGPIDGAYVLAQPVGGGPEVMTLTWGDGTYVLRVPPGDYLLWAGAANYSRQYYDHALWEAATPRAVAAGDYLENIDFDLDTPALGATEQLTFNLARPITGELAVRQAIAHGLDRARISNEAWGGTGFPVLDTYLPYGHWAQATVGDGLTVYAYNPAQAAAILAAAGWVDTNADNIRDKGGQPLAFELATTNSPNRITAALIFKENMAAIGMDVSLNFMPGGVFFGPGGPLATGDFDVAEFAWIFSDANDDASIPVDIWTTGGTANYGGYASAAADAAVTNGRAATNRAAKLPFAFQHQIILSDDLPIFPIVDRQGVSAGPGELTGHVYAADGVTPMAGVTVTAELLGAGPSYTADSGVDGAYSIGDLPGGDFRVSAEGGGFTLEYYDDQATPATADPVAVALGGTTSGIDFANGPCYELALTSNPADGGDITASAFNCPGGYQPGTVVSLTADPAADFVFASWSGDATGTDNPTTVTMNSDAAVTANFSTWTGYQNPTANAPSSSKSGDNNGFQKSSVNAYADDGLFAADMNSGTARSSSCTSPKRDRHQFYTYGIALPGSAIVLGLEVRLDAKADNTTGTPKMCIELSWDGGATWTAAKKTPRLAKAEKTYLLGGSADTWGRAWTPAQLGDGSFRVRITDIAGNTARDFYLDWVAVKVYYQP